jgi:hypothetical protein
VSSNRSGTEREWRQRWASSVRSRPDAEVTRRKKAEKDRLAPKQGTLSFEDDLQEMKPKFPTGEELAETVAVMRVLEAAAEPVSIEEIARHFAQGKAVEKRVGSVVAALARLGHLSPVEGGQKVVLRGGA